MTETGKPKIDATGAEVFAWTAVSLASAVALFAGIAFVAAANSFRADTTMPLVWFAVGVGLLGLTLVPALLLAGQRQLLVQRLALRAGPVDHADAAADDAHDGGGDAAGGENLRRDLR